MKTLLGDWEDSTDVLEYHAEQVTKQKYLKFHQNHLKENQLKLWMFRSAIDHSLLTWIFPWPTKMFKIQVTEVLDNKLDITFICSISEKLVSYMLTTDQYIGLCP